MMYQRKLTWLGIAAAAMFAMTGAASAVVIPLTLTGPIAGDILGPQSTSDPCIIAATNCSQPVGFGFNDFTSNGNISSYNMFSTTPTATVADGVQGTPYTVSQLTAGVGSSFVVAIDVNTAGGAGGHGETLQLFEVIVNGAVTYNYVGPTLIGNIANNGNGFGDWQLGVIDLSSFAPNATVLFHANWTGASDGGESFFLVPATSAIPEPSTWAMMLIGFVGLGFAFRQSRRKVSFA
jgi:hypothetical protein